MPLVREADVEKGAPSLDGVDHPKDFPPEEPTPKRRCCGGNPCRKGWIWAIVVAAVLLGTIIPVGLRDRRQPSTGTPDYKFTGGRLNTTILFDPMSGLSGNETLTCETLQAEMPNVTMPAGSPPPPLKLLGDRLVTADGKDANINGINWFGFNNGKTMVDGLDAEKKPSWEGGDFATIVQQLRLLGFNAVRLPFLFGDLFTMPPQDYSKKCPDTRPTAASLAARTTSPGTKTTAAPPALPEALAAPPGSEAGVCNAYLPNGASTLARFLWVVQYFVANGIYTLIDYHPEPGRVEPVLDSVDAFSHSWLKLWTALTCLPDYDTRLAGRVFLDIMNEPDGAGITWEGGAGKRKPLGAYYLAAMDAISDSPAAKEAGGAPLFFIQGAGQEKLGSNWGDGFVADAAMLARHNLSDPNPFFTALLDKPYRNRVVLSPHLYGPSLSGTKDIGEPQWDKYAASWGVLQKRGYCSSGSNGTADAKGGKGGSASCQKFPVVIGEVGSNFTLPADKEYFDNMVKFMKVAPPADTYPTSKFNRWFWWVYNANSKEVGGVIGRDWQTLDWKKLDWMIQHLGLTPWYKRSGGGGPAPAAAAAAGPAPAPAAAAPAPAAAPK